MAAMVVNRCWKNTGIRRLGALYKSPIVGKIFKTRGKKGCNQHRDIKGY